MTPPHPISNGTQIDTMRESRSREAMHYCNSVDAVWRTPQTFHTSISHSQRDSDDLWTGDRIEPLCRCSVRRGPIWIGILRLNPSHAAGCAQPRLRSCRAGFFVLIGAPRHEVSLPVSARGGWVCYFMSELMSEFVAVVRCDSWWMWWSHLIRGWWWSCDGDSS